MKLGIFAIFTVLIQVALLFNVYALVLLPLILLAFSAGQVLNRHKFTITELFATNKTLMAFVVITCIAVLRTSYVGFGFFNILLKITNCLFFIYCFALMCSYYVKKDKIDNLNLIINYIILPFSLLALTNFLLYFAGVTLFESSLGSEAGTYKALLLSYIGIDITRVEFPLAGGLNSYASYIGALFSITIAVFFFKKKKTFLLYFSILAFLITLLMIDTRASLIYPILIGIYLWFIRSKKAISSKLKWLSIVVVIGPLLYTVLLPWLSTIPGFEFLERGDGDIQTGNARFFIWVISLAEFVDFKLIHLIGYGDYGHFGSGVSRQWAPMFDNWTNPEYKTPHNTTFSLIFDYGYIGLILYMAIIWQSIERIRYMWNIQPNVAKALFCFVLYNIVAGITEVLGGFYFPNYILLFYMVTIVINTQYYFLIKKEGKLKQNIMPHTNI